VKACMLQLPHGFPPSWMDKKVSGTFFCSTIEGMESGRMCQGWTGSSFSPLGGVEKYQFAVIPA
jgi:hypothetical protein